MISSSLQIHHDPTTAHPRRLRLANSPPQLPCALSNGLQFLYSVYPSQSGYGVPGPTGGPTRQSGGHSRTSSASSMRPPLPVYAQYNMHTLTPSSLQNLSMLSSPLSSLSHYMPGHRTTYHTPISPQRRQGLPPHMAAILAQARGMKDVVNGGRRRAATVSGNGQADERAHPSASVHLVQPSNREESPTRQTHPTQSNQYPPQARLPLPQHHTQVNPQSQAQTFDHTPLSNRPCPRINLSPSPSGSQLDASQSRGPSPSTRRATVSGGSPLLDIGTKDEFMDRAEWLWGVLERTTRFLEELEVRSDDPKHSSSLIHVNSIHSPSTHPHSPLQPTHSHSPPTLRRDGNEGEESGLDTIRGKYGQK